ncbi:hypothetical protein RG47T_4745 [Mucilaginibacter polytrichastri]|uniref:Uncharacterized protein n=1 Tax=Mucilaginibacter polytrichastri TaxID=1302689 RepID=A0A1Q6A5H0_9SPHI|nr:hypothetical protein RG47T_4745 [Mucilaginibacter polytrichastri]
MVDCFIIFQKAYPNNLSRLFFKMAWWLLMGVAMYLQFPYLFTIAAGQYGICYNSVSGL